MAPGMAEAMTERRRAKGSQAPGEASERTTGVHREPRRTQQRAAIREALAEASGPLSPLEILGAAQDRVPRLGIATVYRNVRALIADGWLREVTLPGAPSRYEPADRRHHHHFHCRSCDRVFDLADCPGTLKGLAPRGFRAEGHDILLSGLCAGCAR
jgi:Fur family ferric uptake transcriptional regulator